MFTSAFCVGSLAKDRVYAVETTEDGTQVGADENENTEEPSNPSDADIYEQIYNDLIKGGIEITMGDEFDDNHLYSALLQIIKDYIRVNYNYNYNQSVIYNTMFKYITEINIDDMEIESLNGLGTIRFNSLTSLNVTTNSIKKVESSIFTYMPVLENLNLSNNTIESVDFTKANGLKNINLSTNKLSSIDLTMLGSRDININIANNLFDKMTDIKIPTRLDSIHINLINNNITEISDDYFQFEKMTLNLGLQGLKSENKTKIDTSTNIRVFKTNIDNLSVNIYKVNALEDVLIKTIADTDIIDNFLEFKLGAGNYYYEYSLSEESSSSQVLDKYYKSYKFTIKPSPCTVKYEFKGKIYDTFDKKVTGKVKVLLSCEDGGEIYYTTNDQDWIKGTEVSFDKGGNHSVRVKVVLDGEESDITSVFIMTSLNTIIPDGVMLALLLFFALTLFFVVVPLVSRKWFRK